MRIIYVLPYLETAGTELHVLSLAKEMKSRGHDVAILAPDGPLAPSIAEAGIPLHHFISLGKSLPSGARDLMASIRELHSVAPVEIIHVHAGNELLLPTKWAIRKLKPRPKVIFTVHSFFGSAASFDYWLAAKLSNRVAKGAISVSTEEGKRLTTAGLSQTKLRVIHNGVEKPRALSDNEKSTLKHQYMSRDGILLGSIGRLEPQKGYDLLLKALSMAKSKLNTTNLLIIGAGSELDNLKGLASKLGLTDIVHFTGFREDATTLIQACDAFVSSSRLEGLSLALIEAMANGLPILATNIPGNIEALGEGYKWVTDTNPESMAQKIIEFITEKHNWPALGSDLQLRYLQQFTLKAMGDQTEQFYQHIQNEEAQRR